MLLRIQLIYPFNPLSTPEPILFRPSIATKNDVASSFLQWLTGRDMRTSENERHGFLSLVEG